MGQGPLFTYGPAGDHASICSVCHPEVAAWGFWTGVSIFPLHPRPRKCHHSCVHLWTQDQASFRVFLGGGRSSCSFQLLLRMGTPYCPQALRASRRSGGGSPGPGTQKKALGAWLTCPFPSQAGNPSGLLFPSSCGQAVCVWAVWVLSECWR